MAIGYWSYRVLVVACKHIVGHDRVYVCPYVLILGMLVTGTSKSQQGELNRVSYANETLT